MAQIRLSGDSSHYYFSNEPTSNTQTRLPSTRRDLTVAVSPSKSMEFRYPRQQSQPQQNTSYQVLPGSTSVDSLEYGRGTQINGNDSENIPQTLPKTGKSEPYRSSNAPPLPPHPLAGHLNGPMHSVSYPGIQINQNLDDFARETDYETLNEAPITKFPPGNSYVDSNARLFKNSIDNDFSKGINDKELFGDTDSIVQKIHVTKKDNKHTYMSLILCIWMLVLTILVIIIGIISVAAIVKAIPNATGLESGAANSVVQASPSTTQPGTTINTQGSMLPMTTTQSDSTTRLATTTQTIMMTTMPAIPTTTTIPTTPTTPTTTTITTTTQQPTVDPLLLEIEMLREAVQNLTNTVTNLKSQISERNNTVNIQFNTLEQKTNDEITALNMSLQSLSQENNVRNCIQNESEFLTDTHVNPFVLTFLRIPILQGYTFLSATCDIRLINGTTYTPGTVSSFVTIEPTGYLCGCNNAMGTHIYCKTTIIQCIYNTVT